MDLAEFNYDGEPYPIPQHVFDSLVEKYVSGGTFSEREKTLWDYLTEVNEVALAERQLMLVEAADNLDVSDEQLEAFCMTSDEPTVGEDPYAWKAHDGGERPVPADTQVLVRLRDGSDMFLLRASAVIWRWDEDAFEDCNIVAYRLVRPAELAS